MTNFNYSKYYNKNNSSKLLYGLGIIILNLFSKYVEINISKSQQAFIRNSITRELFIFTVIFVGTHDIITSILLTAAFTIMVRYIFNENSRFCILPHEYRNVTQ